MAAWVEIDIFHLKEDKWLGILRPKPDGYHGRLRLSKSQLKKIDNLREKWGPLLFFNRWDIEYIQNGDALIPAQ